MDQVRRFGISRAAKASEAAAATKKCQKCLDPVHWTYECTGKRKTLLSESRSKLLKQRFIEGEDGKIQIIVPPVQEDVKNSDDSDSDSSSSEDRKAKKKKKHKKKSKKKRKRKEKDLKDSESDSD